MRSEGDQVAVKQDLPDRPRTFGKMSSLVIFAVVGDIDLRDKAEQFPVRQRGSHIVELAVHLQRKAYKCQRLDPRALPDDLLQRSPRLLQQAALQEQIAAGIRSQDQLREDDDLRAVLSRLPVQAYHLLRIVIHIRNPDLRSHRRRFDKPISHILSCGLPQPPCISSGFRIR